MPPNSKVQEYPSWERSDLIQRLSEVVAHLIMATEEWYRMQADETRTKAEAYVSSTADSVAGKTRDVELATYHVTASILETRAEMEALKEERNFLLLLINK